jgi:hypothetical protein
VGPEKDARIMFMTESRKMIERINKKKIKGVILLVNNKVESREARGESNVKFSPPCLSL